MIKNTEKNVHSETVFAIFITFVLSLACVGQNMKNSVLLSNQNNTL